jgi:N-acetylmuramoyl-L-alanine amidase
MPRLISETDMAIVCIFEETEGEPYEGKVAVAEVILNRTKEKYESDGTVTGTVLHKMQFSGMNSDAVNRIRSFCIDDSNPIVQDCMKAWVAAQVGSDLTHGCVQYYNPKTSSPSWAEGATVLAEIGHHRFVKLK